MALSNAISPIPVEVFETYIVKKLHRTNPFMAHAVNESSYVLGGAVVHIPQSGEHVEWNGYRIEVVDMDGARIDKLLVTPLEKTEK